MKSCKVLSYYHFHILLLKCYRLLLIYLPMVWESHWTIPACTAFSSKLCDPPMKGEDQTGSSHSHPHWSFPPDCSWTSISCTLFLWSTLPSHSSTSGAQVSWWCPPSPWIRLCWKHQPIDQTSWNLQVCRGSTHPRVLRMKSLCQEQLQDQIGLSWPLSLVKLVSRPKTNCNTNALTSSTSIMTIKLRWLRIADFERLRSTSNKDNIILIDTKRHGN